MMRWYIVEGDWKTPLGGKAAGGGDVEDFKDACLSINKWVAKHMPQFKNSYIRLVQIEEEAATIVDFGSWSVFARIDRAAKQKQNQKETDNGNP